MQLFQFKYHVDKTNLLQVLKNIDKKKTYMLLNKQIYNLKSTQNNLRIFFYLLINLN